MNFRKQPRSFDTFDAWCVHMEEYKEALQKKSSEQKEEAKAVVFTTLHSAKGLEFPVVFLVDAVEGNMPHRKAVMDADIQEERRLFYVGMTRAKDKLSSVLCKRTLWAGAVLFQIY